MVTSGYDHIWDCCCDHGLLGAELLTRSAASNIHFNDIVPELMETVERKLKRFHGNSNSTWVTHCLDVAKLPLAQYQGKHLVIISGVGGDLMTQFIDDLAQSMRTENTLTNRLQTESVDFLLCPVHHQFTLRQKLIELNFSLKAEVLLEENRRFYEILLVSSKANSNALISPVGKDIWQVDSDAEYSTSKRYLQKTLDHYGRIQKSGCTEAKKIISAYQSITGI